MLHPTFEQVNFETMTDAGKPRTDRELLLKLDSQIQKLSEAIERFGETLKYIEDKKIAVLEERVDRLVQWRSEWNGSWKLWTLLSGALSLTVAIVLAVIKL